MRLGNAAAVFAALGDDTRLQLVARLSAHGPQSISRLTETVDVTRQAVTKHLEALADAGLVHSSKDGRERIWIRSARNGIEHSIACVPSSRRTRIFPILTMVMTLVILEAWRSPRAS